MMMRAACAYGILALMAAGVTAAAWMTLPKDDAPEPPAREEARIALSSPRVAQGDTLVIEVFGDVAFLRLNDERVPFSRIGERAIAAIGFDTRAPVGPRTLTYESAHGSGTASFEVVEKAYPVTRIVVPPALAAQGVTSDKLAASIARSDNVTIEDILAVETEQYHFSEPFAEPTDMWTDVGGFGTVREDRNGSIRHLGVDLAGDTGDPVYASNRGVIVFTGALQNYGDSIVIDHGLGIFSIYLHLSAIQTQAGATVERGERIGAIGSTGAYTLAPHLHFSVKVRGVSVDPRTFIDAFQSVAYPDR